VKQHRTFDPIEDAINIVTPVKHTSDFTLVTNYLTLVTSFVTLVTVRLVRQFNTTERHL
jgi:hypothetical protein